MKNCWPVQRVVLMQTMISKYSMGMKKNILKRTFFWVLLIFILQKLWQQPRPPWVLSDHLCPLEAAVPLIQKMKVMKTVATKTNISTCPKKKSNSISSHIGL